MGRRVWEGGYANVAGGDEVLSGVWEGDGGEAMSRM